MHIGKYYAPFNGGIENYTKDLVESVIYQEAVSSTLLVHHHKNEQETEIEDINGINVIRIKKWFTWLYSPISPSFIKELDKAILERKPDVLHIHMPNLSAFACLFSSKARAIPWVIHWHSDVLGAVPDWRIKLAYKGYKIFESILLKKSAAVIATSPNYLNNSTPLSCFKEKSYTVPLGIANKPLDIEIKSSRSKKETSLSLLIIGRLTYYKGHKYLLEAMSRVGNVELVIIGVGELENNLKKLVVKLNLSNRVTFLGNVDSQVLNQSIYDCDLLCLPSIEKTEAFGLVLLEAARLAKPALVTSVQGSGMSWVVDDQITGIVVEPNSSNSLLEALQFSVKNKNILTRFGKAAKNKFDTEFDIEKTAGKVLDIYKKSLLKF